MTSQVADQLSTPDALTDSQLEAANVNPVTRLATDYLNHFNEVEMLVELLPQMPDCLDEVLDWTPHSYVEHFEVSKFNGREIVIAAYETASVSIRRNFEAVILQLNERVQQGQSELDAHRDNSVEFARTTQDLIDEIRPLMAKARSIINGVSADVEKRNTLQTDSVDALFN